LFEFGRKRDVHFVQRITDFGKDRYPREYPKLAIVDVSSCCFFPILVNRLA
jgi:hypothetical protein